MQPDLGDPFAPTWSGRPPHLSRPDLDVWNRWRPLHVQRFRRYYYDVAVGEGAGGALAAGDVYDRSFLRLTRKRIDVVAEDDDAWYLIEVKSQTTAANAGQLLTYRILWNADPPDQRPVNLLLITDVIDTDLRTVLTNLDIPWELVPPR